MDRGSWEFLGTRGTGGTEGRGRSAAGWAVEAVERAERRRSSIAWRLQQLDAIYRLAVGLQLQAKDSSEEEAWVYERWARLRGAPGES